MVDTSNSLVLVTALLSKMLMCLDGGVYAKLSDKVNKNHALPGNNDTKKAIENALERAFWMGSSRNTTPPSSFAHQPVEGWSPRNTESSSRRKPYFTDSGRKAYSTRRSNYATSTRRSNYATSTRRSNYATSTRRSNYATETDGTSVKKLGWLSGVIGVIGVGCGLTLVCLFFYLYRKMRENAVPNNQATVPIPPYADLATRTGSNVAGYTPINTSQHVSGYLPVNPVPYTSGYPPVNPVPYTSGYPQVTSRPFAAGNSPVNPVPYSCSSQPTASAPPAPSYKLESPGSFQQTLNHSEIETDIVTDNAPPSYFDLFKADARD